MFDESEAFNWAMSKGIFGIMPFKTALSTAVFTALSLMESGSDLYSSSSIKVIYHVFIEKRLRDFIHNIVWIEAFLFKRQINHVNGYPGGRVRGKQERRIG
jgi:hypothetical protein